MTKTQLTAALAEKSEISKAQSKAVLEALAEIVYAEAPNGVTIPGLCKIVLRDSAARWGRNPATGEKIWIEAKTKLRITPVKAAKDAILPKK